MSYGSAHLFFGDLRSSKSSTPFNPPPKEGGNIPWSIPHDLFINLEVEKDHLQFLPLSLIKLSQSKKNTLLVNAHSLPSGRKSISRSNMPSPPPWRGN